MSYFTRYTPYVTRKRFERCSALSSVGMRREEKTEELKGLERLKGRGDREDTRTVYGHWGRGKRGDGKREDWQKGGRTREKRGKE